MSTQPLLPLLLALALVGASAPAALAKPAAPKKPPVVTPAVPRPVPKPGLPSAQQGAPQLALATALDTALRQQPQLRQSQADLAVSRANADSAHAALLPQVGISSGYQLGPSRQTLDQAGLATTNLGNYTLGVSGSQLVYDFGQAGYRYQAALQQVDAQADTARATLLSVRLAVRTAFFTALADQALVKVAEETLANQQRHVTQTKAFVEIGTHAPIDLAQTSKDLANARLQLITARNAYETAKAQLDAAMGVEREGDYAIAPTAMPAVPGEDQSLAFLMKEATDHRPDLAALQSRLKAQALTVEAAAHGNYPSVNASAGASTNGTPISTPAGTWNLGLGLSWPVYSGGAREAQATAARASLDSLKANFDYQRQQVRFALEQARLAVVAQKAAIVAAAESTRNARVQLDLAEGRYEAGVGSVIEQGDAQLAYTNARAQEVQENYKLATARAQLLQALGRE